MPITRIACDCAVHQDPGNLVCPAAVKRAAAAAAFRFHCDKDSEMAPSRRCQCASRQTGPANKSLFVLKIVWCKRKSADSSSSRVELELQGLSTKEGILRMLFRRCESASSETAIPHYS